MTGSPTLELRIAGRGRYDLIMVNADMLLRDAARAGLAKLCIEN